MLHKASSALFLILFAILILIFAGGCAGPQRRGGSLSDAADQAAKKPEKQRAIRQITADESDEDEDEDEAILGDFLGADAGAESISAGESAAGGDSAAMMRGDLSLSGELHRNSGPDRNGIDFGFFYTNPSGHQSDGFHGLYIRYSARPQPRIRAAGGFYYGDHTKGTMLGHADGISSPSEFGLDATGRFYLTEDHTFMGLYCLVGFRWGLMTFSFTNPITVIEGGDSRKIKGDRLQIYTLCAGMGATFLQTRFIHLGANITGGFRLGNGVTQEGFDNDLFPPVGYIQFALETSIIPW
ncbi:MAG: hypothetical protein KJ970_17560 [Candidatus Eisenbacteria bacterium]|uniref:Uncharacterized protein n=1 Tax=Eiseniibacteriota bacterium TaxID=2212470 RepID=A0A948S0R3_UNCEI|nr:hypothetical protein [Candidatus Eisenbacteria bacterium]MBU2692727.1 hypothetical protein [Candidatus Eisenbacteria bacterium]